MKVEKKIRTYVLEGKDGGRPKRQESCSFLLSPFLDEARFPVRIRMDDI